MQEQLQKIGDETFCPIAIITKDKQILMGYRHYTPDKWKKISVWTVPGGRCNNGEKIEAALRREVQEEIGVTDLKILEYLGEVPGAKEGDVLLMFACETKQDPKLMEPEKFSEWKWVDFSVYKSGELGVFNLKARTVIINYISRP